jgi:hypothetical protein
VSVTEHEFEQLEHEYEAAVAWVKEVEAELAVARTSQIRASNALYAAFHDCPALKEIREKREIKSGE